MSWTSCHTRPARICFKQALCVAVVLNVSLAQAQTTSELKLYGLLDAGVHHVSGVRGGSLTQLASGIMEGSRWGLTGREDLGGGFATLFGWKAASKPIPVRCGTGRPQAPNCPTGSASRR